MQPDCPICIEALPVAGGSDLMVTRCGHSFHSTCLLQNIVHTRTYICPYCRSALLDATVISRAPVSHDDDGPVVPVPVSNSGGLSVSSDDLDGAVELLCQLETNLVNARMIRSTWYVGVSSPDTAWRESVTINGRTSASVLAFRLLQMQEHIVSSAYYPSFRERLNIWKSNIYPSHRTNTTQVVTAVNELAEGCIIITGIRAHAD